MYDFDYIGSLLLVVALGLFNFTWNQAPLVGWGASYVWSMLIVSLVVFAAFFFWERRMGRRALIPPAVLSKTSLLVYLSLWLGWMSFGTFLLYTTLLYVSHRSVVSVFFWLTVDEFIAYVTFEELHRHLNSLLKCPLVVPEAPSRLLSFQPSSPDSQATKSFSSQWSHS